MLGLGWLGVFHGSGNLFQCLLQRGFGGAKVEPCIALALCAKSCARVERDFGMFQEELIRVLDAIGAEVEPREIGCFWACKFDFGQAIFEEVIHQFAVAGEILL